MSRRWILAGSVVAVVVGFFVMGMSQRWSMYVSSGLTATGEKMGYVDAQQERAYAQLSQCLMYGGTLAFVLGLVLPGAGPRGGREWE